MNADYVYKAVKEVFDISKPIYEEYLIYLVGFEGLYTLIESGFIEIDSVVNNRRYYILCESKE